MTAARLPALAEAVSGVTRAGLALMPGGWEAERGPRLALGPPSWHWGHRTVAWQVPGGVTVEIGSQEPGVCTWFSPSNVLGTQSPWAMRFPAEGVMTLY